MLAILLISCMIAHMTQSLSNIAVKVHSSAQPYYFRVTLGNINAASCGASITGVKLRQNNAWRGYSQTYDGTDFAWDYNGVSFKDMLPISLQITTSRGTITLWGIVETLNGGTTYMASETICAGETASPTTPKPTKSPSQPTTPYPTGPSVCSQKTQINWESYNNQIYFNGNRFNMKGLSWFGFETTNYNLYGLDRHSMSWYFDWMLDNNFNAIRMPFSSDFINGGSSNLQAYVNAVKAAGEKGLLVMLDMHSKTAGAWRDGLDTIDKQTEIGTWRKVASAMVSNDVWNVLFVDVFNEPHDVSNERWTEWVEFCEDVGEAVWEEGLNALIAVEGTNSNCSPISCCWGENLTGVRSQGKTFETNVKQNKFVWSPHVYYGDVTNNWVYSDAGWTDHWMYLLDNNKDEAAIVIGEFGTRSEFTWLGDLADFLISKDQRNHFYWCLNPNSGDTGGLLLDDWTTPVTGKLTILDRIQPNPSKITVSSNRICISGLGDGGNTPRPTDNNNNTPKPTPSPVSTGPNPTPKPTPSPVSSGGGIRIKQNGGVSKWWYAIEFPDGNKGSVSKLEMRDSNHGSWVEGDDAGWGFTFDRGSKVWSGSQHFRITTGSGRKANWNVFDGICQGCTATLTTASAFTEDSDTIGDSSLTWAGLAAIIVCSLLCILCIGGGIWYYKRHYARLNKGQASFEATAADTPTKGNDTPQPQATNEDEAEIEVEAYVEDDNNITTTAQ